MPCTITITHRSVEHDDPEAAGFIDGYWYTVNDDDPNHDRVESALADKAAAEDLARQIAHYWGHWHSEITVKYGDELLPRREDEARVEQLAG